MSKRMRLSDIRYDQLVLDNIELLKTIEVFLKLVKARHPELK